jgi:hypothetical protein
MHNHQVLCAITLEPSNVSVPNVRRVPGVESYRVLIGTYQLGILRHYVADGCWKFSGRLPDETTQTLEFASVTDFLHELTP